MNGEFWSKIIADVFRKLVGGFGWLGVFFVVYSINAEFNGHVFQFLEQWGPPLSICFTILGTLLTTLSIYLYREAPNPPEAFSRFVSAPLVVVVCLTALWLLATRGDLPIMLTNGLAMLGLSGALFRIQINPGLVR